MIREAGICFDHCSSCNPPARRFKVLEICDLDVRIWVRVVTHISPIGITLVGVICACFTRYMIWLSRHLERRGRRRSVEYGKHWVLLDALLWVRVRRAVAFAILALFAAAGALGDEVVQEDSVLYIFAVG